MKLFFTIIAMAICLPSSAQILDKIKKVAGKVTSTISLDKLTSDPVTTSFKDVDMTKYLADDFGNDAVYKNIHDQPYTWEKGFFLTPGFYEGNFNSFCIKAGTYSPQSGNGRFYAALKGPKADIVLAIIEKYQTNPDITQKEVQLLLWAIVAKTDFQKMKGDVKAIALKILTPEQIARLSKGALEEFASNEIKKVAKQNETLRHIIEAENNLRKKYYQGINEYSEYEAIAMRAGVEPIFQGFNKGRWTKHPDGFFIRYRVQGYRGTHTQIYVPENDIEAYAPIRGKGPNLDQLVTPVQGKHYQSRNSIATPANTAGQRIIQTDVPPGGTVWPTTGGGGSGGNGGTGGGGSNDTGSETGNNGSTGGNNGSGGNDGNTGSSGNGGNDGSTGGGNGNTGGNSSGGNLPSGDQETNAFECEEVVNAIADKTIKLEMLNQNIPGLLVCVFKGDSIIHMKAYGKMRYDTQLTLETQLQWASVSKSVTGVAALQMIEDGRLKLSDRPSQLLTYWPNSVKVKDENGKKATEDRYSDITLHQLLTNSSGIQHYGSGKDDKNFANYKGRKIPFKNNDDYTRAINGGWNAKSSVEQFNASVLDYNPGTENLYSSYGFNLAGAMIDSKIHYGYDSWVKSKIATKLGLRSFSMTKGSKNRYGYEFIEDGIRTNAPLADKDDVLPAGGWESTICDLATYTRALSQGELLTDGSALWSEKNMYVFDSSSVRGYGLGVNRRGIGDTLRVYHGGTNGGSRAYIHFLPSDHTGVVMLAPFRQANLERVTTNLFNDLNLRPTLYKSTRTRPLDRCHNGMKSGKDMFIGIWKKTAKEQIIRTGLELVEFRDEINIMREYGYHLDDFEVHMTEDKKTIYDGVFKKGKRVQVLVTQQDIMGMLAEKDRLTAQGLEITDIEFSATTAGLHNPEDIALNALFEKGAPQSNYRTFPSLSHLSTYAAENQNKLNIIDVESHPTKKNSAGGYTWSLMLYVTGNGNRLEIETPLVFKEKIENGSYASLGNLLDVDMAQGGLALDDRHVLSIWDPSGKDDIRTSYVPAKQPALSFCSFMDMHEKNRNDDYELIDFDRVFTIVDK